MKAPKKRVPRKSASIGFTIRKFPIDDNNYVLIKSNDRLINIKVR